MKKKQKQLPFVLGMKLLSLYSFILGLGILSICFWTLLSLCEESSMMAAQSNSSRNNQSEAPKPEHLTAISILNQERALETVNDTEIENAIQNIKDTWQVLSPFFVGSCGVTIICGFIQIITSLVILCSTVPGAIQRTRAWEVIHFMLIVAFTVCFIIPVTIDKSAKDGGVWGHVNKLGKILEPIKGPNTKILNMTNVNNLFLFYISLLVNICGILIGFFASHFCVSKLKSKVKPGKVLKLASR